MTRIHAFGDDALSEHDALSLARAIASGDVSPTEATEAALARIDLVNPALNAVAFDDRTRARTRAMTETFTGVFAGVPSLIKNNTDFAGIPTMHGSAAVPPVRATANERFSDQFVSTGVNVLGATTLPAFGLTATTEFADRAPTRNPWNPAYSSGASSGGSAALVACGAIPIAHANDGGGSIRIPAAACGLVGLKPTRARTVPAAAMAGLPIDIVSNGVLTRTVRDTAHFLAAAEEFLPVSTLPEIGLVEGPSSRRLRIGVVRESVTKVPVDAATGRALEDAVNLLAQLGHELVEIPAPAPASFIKDFVHYWAMLACGITYAGKRSVSPEFDRDKLDPFTRGLARSFLKNAWRTPLTLLGMARIEARYRRVFETLDVVVSPTLGHTTPRLGHLDPTLPFDEVFERLVRYVAFTPLNNASGGPAVSLPLAVSDDNLPIGIHFSADLGRERTLLQLAYELEAAQPFAHIQAWGA